MVARMTAPLIACACGSLYVSACLALEQREQTDKLQQDAQRLREEVARERDRALANSVRWNGCVVWKRRLV